MGNSLSSPREPLEKRRFFVFIEVFFHKFWKLIGLNLLFLLSCIPVVTIGPALCAMAYVTRNFAIGKPLFLVSDYLGTFRKNWKQGFIYGLFFCGSLGIVGVVITLCLPYTAHNPLFQIPLYLCWAVIGVLIIVNFYAPLMIVTLDLPLWDILKNAFILSLVALRTNLITLFLVGNLLLACLYFYPYSAFFVVTILPAFLSLVASFNSYPIVEKFLILPYASQQKREDSIFRDSSH